MNAKELQALANAQAETHDYTKESTGGDFERLLPDAGKCVLRFREYIEFGMQKTATAKYPKKKPALKARFVFELTTPKHQYEVEDSEGNKKKYGHTIAVTVPVSNSGKSNFMKLFKMLNYKGEAKVPAQCLGNAYLAEVVHAFGADAYEKDGTIKKDAKPQYANLNKDQVYTIQPPRIEDPLAGTVTNINVPEMLGDLKLFLWTMPTKETWDSLFIDGTYTNDKDEEISKNWIQNLAMDAFDYEGSKLHEMLLSTKTGETLDDLPTEEPTQEEGDPGAGDETKELEDMLGV